MVLAGVRANSISRDTENTMDTLLSALACVGFIAALVAAVVAIHAEGKHRQPDAFGEVRFDYLARLIRNSGG